MAFYLCRTIILQGALEYNWLLNQEIARFNKFRIGVLGYKQETKESEVNAKNYVKYLLKEGTLIEKRELLLFFKSKLILKDKRIELVKE